MVPSARWAQKLTQGWVAKGSHSNLPTGDWYKGQFHTLFSKSHTVWWWLLHSCWNPALFFLRNSILGTCCRWYSCRWCWTGLKPSHQHRWHLCFHEQNYYIEYKSPAVQNTRGPREAWGAQSIAVSPEAAPLGSLVIPGCDCRLGWVLHSEVGSHLGFLCIFCPSSLFLGWEPGHVLQIAFMLQQKWFLVDLITKWTFKLYNCGTLSLPSRVTPLKCTYQIKCEMEWRCLWPARLLLIMGTPFPNVDYLPQLRDCDKLEQQINLNWFPGTEMALLTFIFINCRHE